MTEQDTVATLTRLIRGFQITQAIHAAVRLGIPDRLADGPRSADTLASEAGAHPLSLYRLMRALAAVGIFHEDAGGMFSLTDMGTLLRTDVPRTLAPLAAHTGLPYYWDTWSRLAHSVRTGETAFVHRHGTDAWTYRATHAEENAAFNRFMAGMTAALISAVEAAYDFGAFRRVVDVGGGNGTLIAALLSRHPELRGVLFDQPHVAAEASKVLSSAGVADRCEIAPGDFFKEVPAGADAYLLKWIIHDWNDADAVSILRTCRRAVAPEGKLVLLEQVIEPPDEGIGGKLSDLNMMVMLGGRERTADEYKALLTSAGFRMAAVVPTKGPIDVIEAVPA
jgi:SAM-dependent methyltransferase